VHRLVWGVGVVAAIVGLVVLFMGYTVQRTDPVSPDGVDVGPPVQARCSMPVRQLVAAPHQGGPDVSDDTLHVSIPNVQPLCRQVGVWRFSTGALLVVVGLGAVGFELTRSRRLKHESSETPAVAVET
jgi:hypothetical protein